MESSGETAWREDTGGKVKRNILQVIKEKWKSVKPSILRYHQTLREKQREDWMQSLKPELEPGVQKILG